MRRYPVLLPVLLFAATSLAVAIAGPAHASNCLTSYVDFDGDGLSDSFFADATAEVEGHRSAGAVYVEYGDGTVQVLTQATPNVPGNPETVDRFGDEVAVADYNMDNCEDLIVAAPNEMIDGMPAAGAVWIFLGGPDGFASQPGSVLNIDQDSPGIPGAVEAYDEFGSAVASGLENGKSGVIAIGSYGENEDGGAVYLLHRGEVTLINQNSSGIPGDRENGDNFGRSLGMSQRHLIVGVPGEGVGDEVQVGIVQVIEYRLDGYKPQVVSAQTISQDTPGVSGASEVHDFFGTTVVANSYAIASGFTETYFAVGVPSEDVGDVNWAGMVHTFTTSGDSVTELHAFHQDTTGVNGVLEASDAFGWELDLDTRAPRIQTRITDLSLIVGVDEDGSDGEGFSGASLHVFPASKSPGAGVWVGSGAVGIPFTNLEIHQTFTSKTWLWIDSLEGERYAVPWVNILEGADEPVRTVPWP
ncbi:VCBS repeat protein [Stackebrandtia albiflava]|uniref:VCBS repeat protein n=1 Tax=Stackebrandtia albiflava TaxID=406432 RepID=A0A562UQ98_9ACTN|nr:VCBS repeat-containing protein [Stackebrandtia albiflava]TWJ07789.1 VCBS repeat protein [Stackebrandtia albiflava]